VSSHVVWRVLIWVVPAALIAGFLLRPTPIVGVDGESLAASSGAPVNEVNSVPCSKLGKTKDGDRWECTFPGIPRDDEEDPAPIPSTYVLTIDGLGCWTIESTRGPEAPPESEGCVTIADHVASID